MKTLKFAFEINWPLAKVDGLRILEEFLSEKYQIGRSR